MTLRAMETDNGPGGMSWEVDDAAAGYRHVGSYPSLDAARAAHPREGFEVYPYSTYEAAAEVFAAWEDAKPPNPDAGLPPTTILPPLRSALPADVLVITVELTGGDRA